MQDEMTETEPMTEGKPTVEDTVGFPCESCGSQMVYSPERGKLYCSYCNSERSVDSDLIEAPEYTYDPESEEYTAPDWEARGSVTMTCPSCGADTVMGAGSMTAACPFCGAHYVSEAKPMAGVIQPETLMPFCISREAAVERFGAWVKKRYLAPEKFRRGRHTLDPSGVYIPFWTFDACVTTDYHGFGGRRRVESYTVRVNGKTERRTRTVTDWFPISGTETLPFDDFPCVASRRIDTALLGKLGAYSMKVLHVYNPAYLAGFLAERYSVGLGEGFAAVRARMEAEMIAHIESVRGYDCYRGMSYHHHYRDVRFKHILLPLWISSYRYHNKVYQLMINGETGKVAGRSPLSALKVAGLVALGILAVGGLILAMMALGGEF